MILLFSLGVNAINANRAILFCIKRTTHVVARVAVLILWEGENIPLPSLGICWTEAFSYLASAFMVFAADSWAMSSMGYFDYFFFLHDQYAP